MNKLDPEALFERIAADIPQELHKHLFVTGSLAAAYHFQAKLEGRAVNTKDADLVVHPAGNVISCQQIAEQLLASSWTKTAKCFSRASSTPEADLRAIRLYPPNSQEYFIEFLSLPEQGQLEAKRWIPVQLSDGWYGLPSFRFMGLAALNRKSSSRSLEYASPALMALANLLSHTSVGSETIQSGTMQGILRSAKDLGRVLALARLTGREETEDWLELWVAGLQDRFPNDWRQLATHAGDGLQELLTDTVAFKEAWQTTDIGLLNGLGVTEDNLRATGERLTQGVLESLAERATSPDSL